MRAVVVVLVLAVSMTAQAASAEGRADVADRIERTAYPSQRSTPPEWFLAEIEYLTRDGGRWVADNSAYRTDDEPYGAFGVAWTRGVSGNAARGRLYGIDDRGREHDLWEMHLFWNEIDGAAVVMQVHKNGTFGTGELVVTSAGGELVQQFRGPDGSAFELRHTETRSADEKRARSFRRSGDEWQPQRPHTWARVNP